MIESQGKKRSKWNERRKKLYERSGMSVTEVERLRRMGQVTEWRYEKIESPRV